MFFNPTLLEILHGSLLYDHDKLGSGFARAFVRHGDKLSVSLVNGPWRSTSKRCSEFTASRLRNPRVLTISDGSRIEYEDPRKDWTRFLVNRIDPPERS